MTAKTTWCTRPLGQGPTVCITWVGGIPSGLLPKARGWATSTVAPSARPVLLHRRRDGGASTGAPQPASPIRGYQDSRDVARALTPSREGGTIDASSIGSPPLLCWSPSTLEEAVTWRTTPSSLGGKHCTSSPPPSPLKKMDLRKKKRVG